MLIVMWFVFVGYKKCDCDNCFLLNKFIFICYELLFMSVIINIGREVWYMVCL